ncbi:MAG: hypothetical protein GTN59_15925, partial [Candidatus Dadabacteria bacterium]|nr:hypothetical protein [Candidatus Dadabacteria bacterium]
MKISITTVRTFIFLFFFTLASTLVSHAATFTVDDLSDGTANASHCEADSPPAGGDCSLRDAVAAANAAADSDTINFSVTGTITLSEGEIAISEDLAITGPGADMLTVDADGNSRIFLVDDSTVAKKVVSLTGLMFINGDSYNGGAILNYEELSVDSCVFEGNSATFSGGAIYNDEDGTITEITSSTFDGNSADRRYGGAIYNFYGIINISFSTIANNSASSSTGGGIFENFGSINIRNSIVAFNGPDNCDKDIAKEAADETNNYSDDDTCGFGTGDNSTILLGDLADNGGPTETLALLGGDPVDGASADCDSINNPGVPVTNDQRYFPRPFGAACDAGAYEDGPMVSVTITKITDPPGGTDFDFTTTGFENTQESCGLKGINGQLVMDYLDSHSCVVPAGDYTVMEDIPDGQVLNIFCTDIPSGSVIDNDTGELSFSVVDDQFDVNCL